jgi:hypothetical protein
MMQAFIKWYLFMRIHYYVDARDDDDENFESVIKFKCCDLFFKTLEILLCKLNSVNGYL